MRAFSVAPRKGNQYAVTTRRFFKTTAQLATPREGGASGKPRSRIERDLHQVFPSTDRSASHLDHALSDCSKISSSFNVLLLAYNVLVQRSPQGDRLATTIALQSLAKQQIDSVEDARDYLARGWSLGDRIQDSVAQALSVRLVQVLCRLGGAAHFTSALDLFATYINHSKNKSDWNKASRDVIQALTSIPPTSPLARTKTTYLEFTMEGIIQNGIRLRERGYEAILRGVPLSPKLLAAIRRDPEGQKALSQHQHLSRHLVALQKQGAHSTARALARSDKVRDSHLSALLAEPHSRSARRNVYLMMKAVAAKSVAHSKQNHDLCQTYLRQFLASKSRQTASILALLEKMEKEENQYPLDVATYTMFIQSLIGRKEWKAAWEVWVKLRTRCFREARTQSALPEQDRAWKLDPSAMSLGVILLCRHKGDFVEAFRMVDGLGSVDSYAATSVGIQVDTFLINGLMEELARAHRTEALYPLWQEMSRQYGVARDQVTLRTLIDAAVLGSVGGETDASMGSLEGIATAVADGFTRMIIARRQRKRTQAVDLTQARFAYRMEVLLGGGRHPREEVLWDGMVAWQRARLIFLEVVLGNWPGLVNVVSPASADAFSRGLTSNGKGPRWVQPKVQDLLTPPSSALQVHQHIEFQTSANPHAIPSPPATSLYPHIKLDDATFQAYIRLLGEHNLAAQIPLTLAWMRALGVAPCKKTLSLSLAYFREVTTSIQPLVYAYGKEGNGEYGRLVQWLEDWVPELVPSEDAIVTAWTRAKRKRELAELWDT